MVTREWIREKQNWEKRRPPRTNDRALIMHCLVTITKNARLLFSSLSRGPTQKTRAVLFQSEWMYSFAKDIRFDALCVSYEKYLMNEVMGWKKEQRYNVRNGRISDFVIFVIHHCVFWTSNKQHRGCSRMRPVNRSCQVEERGNRWLIVKLA